MYSVFWGFKNVSEAFKPLVSLSLSGVFCLLVDFNCNKEFLYVGDLW